CPIHPQFLGGHTKRACGAAVTLPSTLSIPPVETSPTFITSPWRKSTKMYLRLLSRFTTRGDTACRDGTTSIGRDLSQPVIQFPIRSHRLGWACLTSLVCCAVTAARELI